MSEYTNIEKYNFTTNKLSKKAVLTKRTHFRCNNLKQYNLQGIVFLCGQVAAPDRIVVCRQKTRPTGMSAAHIPWRFCGKKQKTEKRTHFAVTKGANTTSKDFLCSFWALGTKFCSKFVETVCGLDLYKTKSLLQITIF